MNNPICSSKLDDAVRSHPTRSVLAAVGTGVVLGVLTGLWHHRSKEPTRMDAVLGAVRGLGTRVRNLFR